MAIQTDSPEERPEKEEHRSSNGRSRPRTRVADALAGRTSSSVSSGSSSTGHRVRFSDDNTRSNQNGDSTVSPSSSTSFPGSSLSSGGGSTVPGRRTRGRQPSVDWTPLRADASARGGGGAGGGWGGYDGVSDGASSVAFSEDGSETGSTTPGGGGLQGDGGDSRTKKSPKEKRRWRCESHVLSLLLLLSLNLFRFKLSVFCKRDRR